MSVAIENAQFQLPFPQTLEALLIRVVEQALKMQNESENTSVNILIADDEQLKVLNQNFRGVDSATDVLSFPTMEFEGEQAEEEPALRGEDIENFLDPQTGELLLGDIAISLERAARQAEEYGHSLEREAAYLTAHGVFHLLGYDHMTPDEDARMTLLVEAVLKELNITRED